MGSAASVDANDLDEEMARKLAGDHFNQKQWDQMKDFSGKISAEDWVDAVATHQIESIWIEDLEAKIEEAYASGLTPLFIDSSGSIDTFFAYQSAIRTINCKKLVVDVGIRKTMSQEEAMEELRQNLVSAMQNNWAGEPIGFNSAAEGSTFHILLEKSAFDFVGKYNAEDAFPLSVFDPSQIVQESVWSKFVRPSEVERTGLINRGNFEVGKKFRVVLTSQFELLDAIGFLKNSLPLKKLKLYSRKEGAKPKPWVPKHGDTIKVTLASEKDESSKTPTENADTTAPAIFLKKEADNAFVKFEDGNVKVVPFTNIKPAPSTKTTSQ